MSGLDPLLEALAVARDTRAPAAFALGTVTGSTGGVQVRFDGEAATSAKAYRRLSSYTIAVNDRVLLARSGTTWVVLGKVV